MVGCAQPSATWRPSPKPPPPSPRPSDAMGRRSSAFVLRPRGGRAVLPSSGIIVAFWIVAIVFGLRPSPAIEPPERERDAAPRPMTLLTNTNRRTLMSESYSLPTEPEGVIPSLIERFNSGKVSAMETLYEGAVLIADDGHTLTDRAEIAAELERDLSLGLPLEAKARHVFVNGDIAQIVVDWSIDGTGPDGKHVHVEGTASDVARRGADGLWRYLIDNRLGTAVRQPA